jgi:hypothetical protein
MLAFHVIFTMPDMVPFVADALVGNAGMEPMTPQYPASKLLYLLTPNEIRDLTQ